MGASRRQTYPFTPRSATALTVGDIIPVESDTGSWACLQVVELAPRKRSYFIIGLLDWRGHHMPTADDVAIAAPLRRALTGVEVFTEGGLTVTGNVAPADAGQEKHLDPGYIGKRTSVWGWRAAINKAKRHADGFDVA
ncbi:hypothetical protein [Curtobacterium sp. MCSS17_016]|uniref:hypothetical protein n=1 Tax=Curtobacterium sp. MCSS17_016 TaxID=2175644 RepID=UPI000DA991E3|nr:hypothetical protein [Curtobacterium sp. MCSS17_016]WIE81377.1 hypothetical protein DEJ19_019270 [Curtobacterium sp. MCSS17_016]